VVRQGVLKDSRRRASARHRRSRATWLGPAAAAILACLVYANALDNPFVYDDRDTVVANPSLVDLSNVRFVLAFSPFRPVLNASYAADRWLWGYRPLGYHLTNTALHALVVVLLYFTIAAALTDARASRASPDDDAGLIRWASFLGASAFAVHPLMSEAVGYVSGRSEVLCAVWFLSSLLLARRAMVASSWRAAAGSAICGVLALASKEVAIALPVVLVAYDWLIRPGPDDGRSWRLWRIYVPALALVAAAGAYRWLALRQAGASADLRTAGLSLLTQAIVIWRYLGLIVWPVGQSIMHGVHRVTSLTDPLAWTAIAAFAGAGAAAVRLRSRVPLILFGSLWFFAAIAPSSSVVALREGMAEHRVYLASAGLFVAAASALAAAVRGQTGVRPGSDRGQTGVRPLAVPFAGVAAALAVLAVLSVLTVRRNAVWASPISLWSEAVERAPGMWEPHYALADALREANRCPEAVGEYERVVELRPQHRDAHTNLGICLGQLGRLGDADAAFQRVLQIDPSFARAYTNLAALALVAGEPARARDYYREAIVKDPQNVLARMQLAALYERTFHDYHAAARMCGEARLIAPATPNVVECVERNQRLAAGR
jgi:tetratricopeptide (TPR) repeat protein